MGKHGGGRHGDFDEDEFLLFMEEEGDGNGDDDYEEDEFSLFRKEESGGRSSSSRGKPPRREQSKPFDLFDDLDDFPTYRIEETDDYDDDDEVELDRDDKLDLILEEYQRKINDLIKGLQTILDREQEFVDKEYDTYGDTDRYAQAEENVDNLGNAISDLESASFDLI